MSVEGSALAPVAARPASGAVIAALAATLPV